MDLTRAYRRTISGLDLRSLLVVLLLDAGRPLTTAEGVARVGRAGFDVPGRPSKAISDSLRWERWPEAAPAGSAVGATPPAPRPRSPGTACGPGWRPPPGVRAAGVAAETWGYHRPSCRGW